MQLSKIKVILALFFITSGYSYLYLPGVAPVQFQTNQLVDLKVNKLTSVHTQLPYKYYTLPFCTPDKIIDKVENLGEILRGDRIENSPYVINAERTEDCKILCRTNHTQDEVNNFIKFVKYEYKVHWIVDNLPVATPKVLQDAKGDRIEVYETGFPLGKVKDENDISINNHVEIKLLFHRNEKAYPGIRIVGFEVDAESRHSSATEEEIAEGALKGCSNQGIEPQLLKIPQGDT